MGPPRSRSGVLLVRAWVEPHPTASLRAVVQEVRDLGEREATTQTAAASVDDVCRLVREWLTQLLAE